MARIFPLWPGVVEPKRTTVSKTTHSIVFRFSFFVFRYLPLYTTRQILPFTLSVMYRVPSGPT